MRIYKTTIKRLIDATLSAVLLIVLSPVFLIIFLIVLIGLGWPVFFIQERVTIHEKVFSIIKFRTMKAEIDKQGKTLTTEERTSRIGNLLRSLSIDELPELVNILKGDLSFVGPRPLYKTYIPFYTVDEKKRHDVRGGLIPPDCLAGKVVISWDEQLKWEAWYAENVTFITDLKVVLLTFKILLMRVLHDYGAERRVSLIEERSHETKRNM